MNECRNCEMLPTGSNRTVFARQSREKNVVTSQEIDTKISFHVGALVYSHSLDHVHHNLFKLWLLLIFVYIYNRSSCFACRASMNTMHIRGFFMNSATLFKGVQ